MLLRSFSFSNELDSRTWLLFKDYTPAMDCADEIIEAVIDHKIDLDAVERIARAGEDEGIEDVDIKPVFNIAAYNFKTQSMRLLGKRTKAKRNVELVNYGSEDEDGVCEESISSFIEAEDEYEKVDDLDELNCALLDIRANETKIMFKYGVDLMYCMKLALSGVATSVNLLKDLCDRSEYAKERIWTILSSGESFDDLYATYQTLAVDKKRRCANMC